MLTDGERTVILVRCDALADALRFLLTRRTMRRPAAVEGCLWHAQRLLSSCERALGTRDRPYD